jgi:ribose 5-phosphate isomerase B
LTKPWPLKGAIEQSEARGPAALVVHPRIRLDLDQSRERKDFPRSDRTWKIRYMKIAIGSDHAGFHYKETIKQFLKQAGYEVIDFGTDSEAPVDYPLFIRPVAEAVAAGKAERGIVLGGSGNGEAITANRVRGIRCALCWNVESARLGRLHNNANVISLGERMMTSGVALDIVRTWLETPFEGGRHQHRIDLIDSVAG